MEELLKSITKPNDIKNIDPADYNELARQIRSFLVRKVSKTGGHLASNLGVVELTMALHLFLDLPKDKLIFDVGHQCYTHKILTGRKDEFDTLRQLGGLSGFPKRCESDCDIADTGHSSTSISIASGLVKARDLNGDDYKVVAVIGDGALSGGMAYEAMNNVGRFKSNMIIVLNDNNMSISENVGAMSGYLGKIRTSTKYTELKSCIYNKLESIPVVGNRAIRNIRKSKDSIKQLFIPGMFFENMGLTYIGPVNGHNIPQLLESLENASQSKTPVLLHVITKKGKGYHYAEQNACSFHSIDTFDAKTGMKNSLKKGRSYTDVFSETLVELGQMDPSIVGITAAMADGTGLTAFKEAFPDRFFDVGIAEQHAVTFAAGMAIAGMHPVVAIYSTFLQRAYDQIIHDICINKLPVTLAVDRAGIVGADGETHQGIFDLSFLSHIPGLCVMAPKSGRELTNMMHFAVASDYPNAVRYPRGIAYEGFEKPDAPIEYGRAEVIEKGTKVALIGVGYTVRTMQNVYEKLESQGISCTLVNARFINPIDTKLIDELASTHSLIVTCEENVYRGGFGETVGAYLCQNHKDASCGFLNFAIPDDFLIHGKPEELRRIIGIDSDSITREILKKL